MNNRKIQFSSIKKLPKIRFSSIKKNLITTERKTDDSNTSTVKYLDSLRTLSDKNKKFQKNEESFEKNLENEESDLMKALLDQNIEKLDNENILQEELLSTIRNQNYSLLQMKKKLLDFLNSETYQELKLVDLNKLIKYKIKREKELKLHKLDCFVKNITEMIMINPNILKDPQIIFLIQNAKEEAGKYENIINKKNKRLINGNSDKSFDDDLDFSDEEERERYLEAKKARKALILKNKEMEILNQEKIKLMEEFNNKETFKVPDGMLLIAKNDYQLQLNNLKIDTEKLMSEKFKELLKEELEKYELIRLQKKLQKEKLKRVRRKLRGHYWAKALPLILLKRTRIEVDETRRNVLNSYTDTLPQVRDISFTIMKNVITKNCKDIWEQELSYNVMDEQSLLFAYKEKPVNSKDLDKNISVIEEYTRKILVGMIESCSEEILGKNLIDFLKNICFDGGYLPQNFLTQFELDRLEFDSNGKIIKMNPEKRKMIIGFFLVYYIMLSKVLTKPWRFDKSIPETFKRRLLLRMIGSIIFIFFMNYFKKNVSFIGETQAHIKVEIRTKNREPEQLYFDERAPRKDIYEDEDLFGDCFTKVQLKKVFFDKIAKFEKISVLVETFLDKIHIVVVRSYEGNLKVENEERFKQMIKTKKQTVKFLKRIKVPCKVKESFIEHLIKK